MKLLKVYWLCIWMKVNWDVKGGQTSVFSSVGCNPTGVNVCVLRLKLCFSHLGVSLCGDRQTEFTKTRWENRFLRYLKIYQQKLDSFNLRLYKNVVTCCLALYTPLIFWIALQPCYKLLEHLNYPLVSNK